jgi:hypothetical protein
MEQSYRQMARANATREALDGIALRAEPGSDLEKYFQAGKSPLGWERVQPGKHNISGGVQNPLAKTEAYKDHWIPRDVARAMNFSEKVMTDHSTGAELAQTWSKIQGHWKGLVVASPGYFSRTSMGDLIMNAASGVRGIKPYTRAKQILSDVKVNEDLDVFNAMRDPNLPMGATISRSKPGATHVLGSGKNTVRLSSQDINNRFIEEGGASGLVQTERVGLPDEVVRNKAMEHAQRVGTKTSQKLNQAEAYMADLNNKREKYFRMAHFADAWDRYLKKGLTDEAASKAAMADVRKFNIDYRNLSSFERNSVRKVIPFYSWFRRNSQLQAQMLFTKPGFMTLYPKTTTAIQNMLGTDEGNGDWMLPQWIRESAPVRLVAGEAKNSWLNKVMRFAAGAGTGEAVFAPLTTGMTPLQDLETVLSPIQKAYDEKSVWGGFKEAGKALGGMTSPIIRAPFEAGTGKSLYSGAPIKNWNNWLLGQLGPPGRAGQMLSGGEPNMSAITSFLTGAQVQPITQARQRSEYQRRKDILDKSITSQRKALAKERGISEESPMYEKLNTIEMRKLRNYLTKAGRSVNAG